MTPMKSSTPLLEKPDAISDQEQKRDVKKIRRRWRLRRADASCCCQSLIILLRIQQTKKKQSACERMKPGTDRQIIPKVASTPKPTLKQPTTKQPFSVQPTIERTTTVIFFCFSPVSGTIKF